MPLNTQALRDDGFTEDEIRQFQEHHDAACQEGRFSREPAVVQLNGQPRLVCRTTAEILDKFRPGSWLSGPTPIKPTRKSTATARKTKKPARTERPIKNPSTKQQPGNLIKVHMAFPHAQPGGPAGEYLWALRISPDTAKIDTIPVMTSQLARGDLVRIDRHGNVLAVLEHVARTRALIYADDEPHTFQEITERYATVREVLSMYDIGTERMVPGICSISVPNDINEKFLAILAERLDATLLVHLDGEPISSSYAEVEA